MWWFCKRVVARWQWKNMYSLGDIVDHDCRLSENQGMTPQVFELC